MATKAFTRTKPLKIDDGIPIPSEASKVRTREESNPLRSMRDLEIGQSIYVPLNILASHILDKLNTEKDRGKALDMRIASYASKIRRKDQKMDKNRRKFCVRVDYDSAGIVVGARTWRVE